MNIDELHNKLAEKDWLIEDLTEVDYLLIAHVKEIIEQQLTIHSVVDSLTTKEAIDYEVMRKRQDKEENLQSWVFAGCFSVCLIVGLLVLIKSCTS